MECTEKFYENLRILLSFVSVPYFTQESVDKEQGIIAQEIRMIEDEPDWQVYANLMKCLYRDSPVRVPVVGSIESIRRITPQVLYDCHRAFYTPSNMVLVCVGAMDPEKVVRAAEEILPKESGPAILRDYGAEEALLPAKREARLSMEVSMPMFLAGYKCRPPERRRGPAAPEHYRRSGLRRALRGQQPPLHPPLRGGRHQRQSGRQLRHAARRGLRLRGRRRQGAGAGL